MSVDVYTQHLACTSAVLTALLPASLAALILRRSDIAQKARPFSISSTEGENKDTFNIKARQCHAT